MRQRDKKYFLEILDALEKKLQSLQPGSADPEMALLRSTILEDFFLLRRRIDQAKNELKELATFQALAQFLCSTPLDRAKTPVALAQLRHLFRAEPVIYKVVFMPYLASTWDALESVYEAFARDERFMAHVVIAPTFRDTPKGRVSLYEDFLAGTDIPHTPPTKYDIEKDRPDIVFMNNPWGDVEPAYSADHIRQYCEMLVYIPYYGVIQGTLEQNRTEIYGQAVHQLADKIIVQSEIVAQAYDRHCPGPQGRYLALGTPKIDAFKKKLALAAANPKAEWVEKIDGRPVFLLDTHYRIADPANDHPLPDGQVFNYALLILASILDHFAQRPDLFLIWRPHPLTKTITDNFSEVLTSYQKMSQYLDEAGQLPNGLIDREKDVSMAAHLSTAFISLGGSLNCIYPVTGKSVIHPSYFVANPISFFPNENIFYFVQLFKTTNGLLNCAYRQMFWIKSAENTALKKIEQECFKALDNEIIEKYHYLIEKNGSRPLFTPEFLKYIKGQTPDPVLGHASAADSYYNSHGKHYLLDEVLADFNLFDLHLRKHYSVKYFLNIIDRLAQGDDSQRESHQAAYRKAIANTDQNCGELVHEAIVAEFLAKQASV
ncbi:MAG: hypothetical protein LBP55_02930 [Candidatus Adiutrix sp.]|jgi:hypothetical protein|nr:hypothetical protein [Candidatus Adiutrix sp.]